MSDAYIKFIMLEIGAGIHIATAKMEAARWALEHRCTVRFWFNGKLYETDPTELADTVGEIEPEGGE